MGWKIFCVCNIPMIGPLPPGPIIAGRAWINQHEVEWGIRIMNFRRAKTGDLRHRPNCDCADHKTSSPVHPFHQHNRIQKISSKVFNKNRFVNDRFRQEPSSRISILITAFITGLSLSAIHILIKRQPVGFEHPIAAGRPDTLPAIPDDNPLRRLDLCQ